MNIVQKCMGTTNRINIRCIPSYLAGCCRKAGVSMPTEPARPLTGRAGVDSGAGTGAAFTSAAAGAASSSAAAGAAPASQESASGGSAPHHLHAPPSAVPSAAVLAPDVPVSQHSTGSVGSSQVNPTVQPAEPPPTIPAGAAMPQAAQPAEQLHGEPTAAGGVLGSSLMLAQAGTAPDWVVRGLRLHGQRGPFLTYMYRHLDAPDVAAAMSHMPNMWQTALMSSLLLTADAWTEPAGWARRALAEWGRLRRFIPLPPPGANEVRLVALVFGHSPGVEVVGLQGAVAAIAKFSNMLQVRLLSTICFNSQESAQAAERGVLTASGALDFEQAAAPELWEDAVRQRTDHWRGLHAKFLVIHALPAPTKPSLAGKQEGPGFHHVQTRCIWVFLRCMRMLYASFGDTSVAVASFSRPCPDARDESFLESIFGPAAAVDEQLYQLAACPARVRTVPALPCVPRHVAARTPTSDRWKREAPGSALPSPSQLERMVDSRIFDDLQLADGTADGVLASVSMVIGPGSRRFMSRPLLFGLWDVHELPVEAFFKKSLEYKCYENIVKTTGDRSPSGACSEECGTTRWCKACEEVYRLMYSAPNARLVTDVTTALIALCADVWLGKSREVQFRQVSPGEHHVCTAGCAPCM